MSDQSVLESLLLRFEKLQEQGTPISPEELCADCPDLLEEIKRRVAALASIDVMRKERESFTTASGAGATDASISVLCMASTVAEGPGAAEATAERMPRIPGYTIRAELAKGGMGRVYAAWDGILEREVAIKMLLPGAPAARFVTESKITGRLPHPGIPPVHALGRLTEGRPYLVMKLVRGKTLAEILKERSSPTADQPRLIHVFEQIAQAVGFAHQQGIIHRDLKPLNVMVGEFGEVQVMDWGLAKDLGAPDEESPGDGQEAHAHQTAAGTVMGTPGYMAPEQARGEPADARADVFALGSILAAILSGMPAFAGSDKVELIRLTAQADLAEAYARLAACGADEELIRLAKHCLAAKAADRPADAREAAAAVAAYRTGVEARLEEAQLERAAALVREREQVRRRRVWLALAVTLLAATAVSAGLGLWANEARKDADIARAAEARRATSESQARQNERKATVRAHEAAKAEESARLAAEAAEDETLLAYRASTDEAIERLIGAKPTLGKHEKAYLESTLSHWQAFADRTGDDVRSQAIRAEGMYRVGVIWNKLGDKARAAAGFAAAQNIMQSVLAREPKSLERRLQLSTAQQELGSVLAGMARFEESEAEYIAAISLRQALVQEFPEQPQLKGELAKSHYAMGSLRETQRDLEGSVREYTIARDIEAAVVEKSPDRLADLHMQALCEIALGTAYSSLGRWDDAAVAFQSCMDVSRNGLTRAEGSLKDEFQRTLSASRINRANRLASTGKLAEARAEMEESAAFADKLAREFPRIASYQVEAASCRQMLARILRDLQQFEDARSLMAEQCSRLKRLVAEFPEVAGLKADLAAAHTLHGQILVHFQMHGEARTEHEAAVEAALSLTSQFPDVPDYQTDLARMYNNLGMYLIELREDAAAFAAFDSALEIQRKLAEAHRDSVFFQRSLGTMHNNLAMVFHMRGVFASAQEQYLNAKGVQADLAARFPEERMLQLELARTCHNLGLLYTSSREHFADAEKEYSEALATLDRYRQQLPEDAEGMQLAGSTRFNLAALLGAKGDATGAQRQLEAARSIQLEAAEKYPEPATFLALAKTQVNLGSSLLGQNELQAAAREFAAGRDSLQSLVQRAGGYIPDYHIALGEARHNLAIALGELRRFEEAQAEYVAANAVLTELVSRFPENPSYAVSLANSCMQFGQFTRDRAGPEASLEWFDRAIGALEPLVERAPSARAARVLRNSYLCRAEMRDRLQSFDEGEQDWRRVLALSPKEEQATWRLRRVLSRYLGGLIVEAAVDAEGLLTEDTWQANDLFNFACVFSAASLKSQEKGDAYANLAMEQLQKAVTAGYRNVEQLTNDRDLAALREREDFKALLESLRK